MSRVRIPAQFSKSDGSPESEGLTVEVEKLDNTNTWIPGTVYASQDSPTVITNVRTDKQGSVPGWVEIGTYRATCGTAVEQFNALPGSDMSVPAYGNYVDDYVVWDKVHGSLTLPTGDESQRLIQVGNSGEVWKFNRTGLNQWQFAGGTPLQYRPSENVVAGTVRGLSMPLPLVNCTYLYQLMVHTVYAIGGSGYAGHYKCGVGTLSAVQHWFPGGSISDGPQAFVANHQSAMRYPKSASSVMVSRPGSGANGNYFYTYSPQTGSGAFLSPVVKITPLKAWT